MIENYIHWLQFPQLKRRLANFWHPKPRRFGHEKTKTQKWTMADLPSGRGCASGPASARAAHTFDTPLSPESGLGFRAWCLGFKV